MGVATRSALGRLGWGTYTASGTTLARTTILASSNAGAAVSWSAGTRRVALVAPAAIAGINAPVSTAQAAALAPLASPALTGTPTAPTATAGDSTTKLATTAFSAAAILAEATARNAAITTAIAALNLRPILTANRTYYVLKTGSDSNNGLANTSGGAFLTIMAAMNAAAKIDFNGFQVTVQVGDGTYSERVVVPRMTGQKATADLLLQGNLTTPANVIVSNSNSYQPCIECDYAAQVTVASFRVTATNSGYGLNAAEAGVINVAAGMDFGACGSYHMYANNGGTINCFGAYTISGAAQGHWVASFSGALFSSTTVNANSAALAFSFGFAAVFNNGSMQINGNTFQNVASITGPRYAAQTNGTIQTFGGGASYLPGSTTGSVTNGGVYQ